MKKELCLIFATLIFLSLLAVPVFAQEEETAITIAGMDICLIFSSILVIILGITLIIGFRIVKKLYGGRFTNALPYLLMAIALLFGMEVLCLFGDIYQPLGESLFFAHGIQMLQLVAGVFFITALYQIYQSRFATAGFIGGKE
jgi:hypothetical protein